MGILVGNNLLVKNTSRLLPTRSHRLSAFTK